MNQPSHLEKYRHSLAHLLAAAVLELWPDTKPTIGPAVENGFYYDFEFKEPINEKDFTKIENKMRELLKHWEKFEHKEVSAADARKHFKDNPYKLELIDEIVAKGEKITLYTSGTFTDLCRGGHVENPKKDIASNSFKLERVAGAYWRGDEKNTMLTRVYGNAFETKEALDAYLVMMEEARKRDHKKLGKELDLFIFSELVGPGLPIYTPKGTALRQQIINVSRELQNGIGFQEVHTPNMNKAELFKVSGHYEKYREDMFQVSSQYTKEEYFLKPMNCPQHTQVYASKKRSYRDLPVRISDFANLYRDENLANFLASLVFVLLLRTMDTFFVVKTRSSKNSYLYLESSIKPWQFMS
jgi:threonyl-tRNA synthetase